MTLAYSCHRSKRKYQASEKTSDSWRRNPPTRSLRGSKRPFCGSSHTRALRDDQDAWDGLSRRQVCTEIVKHRMAIVRDQDPAFRCRAIQDFGIADTIQSGLLRRREVDGRLSPPHSLDNAELEIVICLKANAQERRSP
jgi:hypothetical protein